MVRSSELFSPRNAYLFCSKALADAFHKGKMLHRDVSKGNVMTTERRGDDEGPWGVLNDWDRATRADIDSPYRTVRLLFLHLL